MKSNLIKFATSLLLLGAAIWAVGSAPLIERLAGLSYGWLFATLVALTAATASMARRWQIVARHLGIELSYGTALREYYIGTIINQTLPGGITGDIARAFRARSAVDLKAAALSVALERLLGQIALFTVFGIGLTVALLAPGGIAWSGWAWLAPITLIGFVIAWGLLARKTGRLADVSALALALQRRPELSLHAIFTVGCLIFGFYASARATGIIVPPEGWVTLVPLILMAMLVPLSIGGWGWREGAAAALFPLIGAPASAGVAAALVYGSAILIAALPAALFLGTTGVFAPPLNSDKQGLS